MMRIVSSEPVSLTFLDDDSVLELSPEDLTLLIGNSAVVSSKQSADSEQADAESSIVDDTQKDFVTVEYPDDFKVFDNDSEMLLEDFHKLFEKVFVECVKNFLDEESSRER